MNFNLGQNIDEGAADAVRVAFRCAGELVAGAGNVVDGLNGAGLGGVLDIGCGCGCTGTGGTAYGADRNGGVVGCDADIHVLNLAARIVYYKGASW